MMKGRMIDLVSVTTSKEYRELIKTDLQHHLYLLNYDGKLFICPMDEQKEIHRVLDVGTGTGIWAIDFGDEFPESKVYSQSSRSLQG
jgi:tRNA1(Val) A37 N6-methylase TrmN6